MADDYVIKGGDLSSQDLKRIKQGVVLSNNGKVEATTYHYEEIMDQLVKTIEFAVMEKKIDKKARAVLLLRLIHGFTIERMQTYLFFHGFFTGNSREELEAIEEQGKRVMHETLQLHSIQDIINTVNANSRTMRDLRNQLSTPSDLGLT